MAPQFVNAGANKAVVAQQTALSGAMKGYAPYALAGKQALGKEMTLLGLGKGGNAAALKQLRSTPGFQFAEQQGDQATINAATATGMNLSGNTLEALSQYNQGLATNTFQNEVGDLSSVVSEGFAAANAGSQAQLSTGSNISNIDTGQGTTLADLYAQRGTALGNVDIGAATNQANIGIANASNQASIVNNAMQDYLLYNMSQSGGG